MLRMNTAMREMAFNREPTQAIRQKTRQLGMRSLLDDGIMKAVRGDDHDRGSAQHLPSRIDGRINPRLRLRVKRR